MFLTDFLTNSRSEFICYCLYTQYCSTSTQFYSKESNNVYLTFFLVRLSFLSVCQIVLWHLHM